MPKSYAVQNNFLAGLKTEFTGLNFPENAATDTANCVFSLIGDVTRRPGIDYEPNYVLNVPLGTLQTSYVWSSSLISTGMTLSNGGLTVTETGSSAQIVLQAQSQFPVSRGKFYFEVTYSLASTQQQAIGIVAANTSLTPATEPDDGALWEPNNGLVIVDGNDVTWPYSWGAQAGTVGVAVDFLNQFIWWTIDGISWNGSSAYNPSTLMGGINITTVISSNPNQGFAPFILGNATGDVATINTGSSAFTYDLPSGFDNWSTIAIEGFTGGAISTFNWTNAGGDGETKLLVQQTGDYLSFYEYTETTSSVSSTILVDTVSIAQFMSGSEDPGNVECQYASGNGYLFVYNPLCNPFYCIFNNGIITSSQINVQTRDFLGYYPDDSLAINERPTTLSPEHQYNLENQGWTVSSGSQFSVQTPNSTATKDSYFDIEPTVLNIHIGEITFSGVPAGLPIQPGMQVSLSTNIYVWYFNEDGGDFFVWGANEGGINLSASGNVINYTGTTLIVAVSSAPQFISNNSQINFTDHDPPFESNPSWSISVYQAGQDTIYGFKNSIGVFPSNADIWYTFKDSSGDFDPASTIGNVTASNSPAPRGYFILNAFDMEQSTQSGVSSVTNLSTTARPSTGAWFQGRVWYSGVNGSQPASGDQNFFTWSENIYFSQIIQANDVTSFGYCYQTNDPTNENFFDLLPTDGGVITIQGCGNIYKLFPIQNGMLVFAQNGVWFITGSTGIGFAATDYTITKISSVQSIGNTSFIDVMGLPFFWNEEGIYRVTPAQQQGMGLAVEPLTVGTILQFYNEIPLDSKRYARGDYDPINYVLKWVYRIEQETGQIDRYQFDGALNLNIYNKSFSPDILTYDSNGPFICGVNYINFTNSITAPDPGFRFLTYTPYNYILAEDFASFEFTFATETDETNWVDWLGATNGSGIPYDSFFVTGYNLHGKGIFKFQPVYVMIYTRGAGSYLIQSIWDYASSSSTGRYSTEQLITNPNNITYASGIGTPDLADYDYFRNRIKVRGHGEALQLRVSSYTNPITNQSHPFDIIGWTVIENVDAGI